MKKTDEQNSLTIPEIIKKLKLYGIDAERKSVSRDIQTLIDSNYSILSAGKQEGFYMTDHTFEDYELKIISDAISSAMFITKKDSIHLVDKLKLIATPTGEKILGDMLHIDEDIKTDNIYSKQTIDKIISAIKSNRKINFQYYDFNENYEKVLKRDGHIYSISPYYLIWKDEEYFLLGNPDSHNNLTHFQISMMFGASISDQRRKSHDEVTQLKTNFDLGKYIRENINMYTGEIINVTLKCHNSILKEILKKFGKNTRILKVDKIYFKVNIMVTDNDGLYQWIMQFGQLIEVVSPTYIRTKIKTLLLDSLKNYQ